MRLLRFLFLELIVRGVLFTVLGTLGLVSLYLGSIGAPLASYGEAFRSLFLMVSGSEGFSQGQVGFSAWEIIQSGAGITFPLALGALFFMTLLALFMGSVHTSGHYLSREHRRPGIRLLGSSLGVVLASMSALPLFVGFWVLASIYGISPPFVLISLMTVGLGGLGYDAARFLLTDMERQSEGTYSLVYTSLGHANSVFFPLPGTHTGYWLNSSAPRFIPYLAGKVPAIIGSITIAEMVFSFPGLGRTLLEALLAKSTDQLIAAVFVLLTVNALVTFLVKGVLFLMYPRWYEKAI